MREALTSWIAEQLDDGSDLVDIHRIATGHSRAMWYVEFGGGQRFVARVEQGGVFGTSGAEEFAMMDAARALGCPVARVRWNEPTAAVIGQPFFVMDFVDSVSVGREDRSMSAAIADEFVATLHRLHGGDWRAAGLDPDSGVNANVQQIERWYRTYRKASSRCVPLLEEAKAWLIQRAPECAKPGIVHGDPGPGNFLHDGSRIVALTDWEFAHIGDPIEDWAYLISMRGSRTMAVDEWRHLIGRHTGVTIDDDLLRYWTAFNLFKGACANLTCLDVFTGANRAPNMAIIGTALQQSFLRRLVDLVGASSDA